MDRNLTLYTTSSSGITVASPTNQVTAYFPSGIQGRMFDGLISSDTPIITLKLSMNTSDTVNHAGYLAWFPHHFMVGTPMYPHMTIESYPKELFFAELSCPHKSLGIIEFVVPEIKVPYSCGRSTDVSNDSHIIHFFDYNAYTITNVSLTAYRQVRSLQ